MKNKLKVLIFILHLFKYIISITVYQCSNMDFLPDQCMLNYTDNNGDTHILLKICPENTICQPNRDFSMGFCVFNAKELPPSNKCYYSSQCSIRICTELCQGYYENRYCTPEKLVCNSGLNCRKTYEENRYVYKCLKVSELNEECENNYDCGFNLECAYNKKLNEIIDSNNNNINYNDIYNLMNSPFYLNLSKNLNKTCINRASLNNGEISNEQMACQSGELIPILNDPEKKGFICGSKKRIIKDCDKNNKCIVEVDLGLANNIEVEQDCLFSNLGNLICPLKQKEKAWKNYLDVFQRIYEKEKLGGKIHIPYNKYDLQNYDVTRAYWEYYDWIHSIEGDECSKEYFFMNNNANMIFYNIYYIIEILLLYILSLI